MHVGSRRRPAIAICDSLRNPCRRSWPCRRTHPSSTARTPARLVRPDLHTELPALWDPRALRGLGTYASFVNLLQRTARRLIDAAVVERPSPPRIRHRRGGICDARRGEDRWSSRTADRCVVQAPWTTTTAAWPPRFGAVRSRRLWRAIRYGLEADDRLRSGRGDRHGPTVEELAAWTGRRGKRWESAIRPPAPTVPSARGCRRRGARSGVYASRGAHPGDVRRRRGGEEPPRGERPGR